MTGAGPHPDRTWVDDQLTALLGAIRRHIHAAPPGTWDAETLRAAKAVTTALSARLAGSSNDGRVGVTGEPDGPGAAEPPRDTR